MITGIDGEQAKEPTGGKANVLGRQSGKLRRQKKSYRFEESECVKQSFWSMRK